MLESFKSFIGCIIMILALYISGRIIINKKQEENIIKSLIIILIAALLNTLIFICTTGTIKSILICILYMISFKYLFDLQISKSIFLGIIYMILLIIPDLLIMTSSIYIFNIQKDYFYCKIAGSIVGNIFVNSLMILLIYLLRKVLRKLLNFSLSTSKKIIIIAFFTLITLALFFYNLITRFEFNNNIFKYLIIIVTLIGILFTLFKEKMNNEIALKKYDELLDITKNYENDIEEQRILVHETKNELVTIKSKIEDKEKKEEIIKYINSILGDKGSLTTYKYSKFKYLPSNGIKGFLYFKVMEAERQGINMAINISSKIENSFLKDIDTKNFKNLVRIIGVYLDNAIEASVKSEKKNLGIEIYLINNNVKIIISNTYNDEINKNKIGKENYSTKGKNRGHGLLLVNKIIKENKMFDVKNNVTTELFIQELTIKNINNN